MENPPKKKKGVSTPLSLINTRIPSTLRKLGNSPTRICGFGAFLFVEIYRVLKFWSSNSPTISLVSDNMFKNWAGCSGGVRHDSPPSQTGNTCFVSAADFPHHDAPKTLRVTHEQFCCVSEVI